MIDELDNVLKGILEDIKDFVELPELGISFLIPKQDYDPKKPTINLYLYDVHENRELRDPVPIIERVEDSYIKRKPPLRVDCAYMATAWSMKQDEEQPDEEHRLLSHAMLWLSRFPTIPDKYLPDDWKDKTKPTYQPFPPPMWVAQMDGVKEPGEFWAALGSPPRPFFNLIVTIAMDLRKPIEEGPPVTAKVTTYGQKEEDKEKLIPGSEEEFIQIGGRVFDAENPEQGIGGARVLLVELNKIVVTDEKGRFSFPSREESKTFPGLTKGEYTLQVYAQGFKKLDKPKKINVPGPSEEYEIGLIRAGP